MFVGKAKSVVKISVIEDDVAMGMGLVCVDCKHILIVALQETVTKLLSDLHSLFWCDFTGGKALYHVIGKDLCSSCACSSDGAEVLAYSCAVGSASIRVDIYAVDGLISVCDVSNCRADCCFDAMDRSNRQISPTSFFISVISSV